MHNRRMKFAVAIALLVSAVAWLGVSGFEDGASYYKTADEYVAMSAKDRSRRIRLMGDVATGSIRREGGVLHFTVTLNNAVVPVVYRGDAPVPDTFKEGVSVLVEGTAGGDQQFVGKTIQAKCASKYEADPADAYGPAPVPGT